MDGVMQNRSQDYRCTWNFFSGGPKEWLKSYLFKQLFRYVKATWWNKIFKCSYSLKAQCSEIMKKPKDIMETAMKVDPVALYTILLYNFKNYFSSLAGGPYVCRGILSVIRKGRGKIVSPRTHMQISATSKLTKWWKLSLNTWSGSLYGGRLTKLEGLCLKVRGQFLFSEVIWKVAVEFCCYLEGSWESGLSN